jgi:hypothetical protein
MAKAKTKTKEVIDRIDPEVIVGSHLTVYKYANGETKLVWDDAALTRDVQEALDSVHKPDPKKSTKKVKQAVEEVVEKISKTKKKTSKAKIEVVEEKPKKATKKKAK